MWSKINLFDHPNANVEEMYCQQDAKRYMFTIELNIYRGSALGADPSVEGLPLSVALVDDL